MNAKQKLRIFGYTQIQKAGYWNINGKKIPVMLIQRPYGDGITIGGNRRQLGRQIKQFARTFKERVIACAQFEIGATAYRWGKVVYRVSPCTHWDDDCERIIIRNDNVIVQRERREFHGNRSFDTDEWVDVKILGPVAGLEVIYDCPSGCTCDKCY